MSVKKATLNPRKLAKSIAGFASDKKAENILVLDMRQMVNFCDYFVICSGNTDRHVRAIADGIDQAVEDLGLKIRFKQGFEQSVWVVLDLGDVVVHVFQKQMREFYRLEHLWREAKRVKP